MRKIALISLIAFLDIAFIVMIRGDLQLIQPPVEVTELVPPDLQPLDTAESLIDAGETVVTPETSDPNSANEPTPVTRRIAASRRASTRDDSRAVTEPAFKPESAQALDNGFKDTIIWYKKANYVKPQETAIAPELPKEQAEAEPVARIAPPKRKRSFISRAGTIVTKPYDWLKELASKFH